MGTKHLQQMYADALEIDCRALPQTVDLMALCAAEHYQSRLSRGLWSARHIDDIMDMSRRLLAVGDEFQDDLKHLLVTGDVRVHMTDSEGRTQNIKDTRVIDFDDPVASEEKFFQALAQCPSTTLYDDSLTCLLEN